MANWKQFEIDCTNYLKKEYGHLAKFTHEGGSDSTIPDILAQTNLDDSFYIEVKLSPAQSGQFVLLPDIDISEFIYSSQNTTRLNSYAETIIAYMNSDFDKYRLAGTGGESIDIDEDIFAQWIIEHYSNKGVEFFISNDYVIIPINEIANYFDITATYRTKRSGSSPVGQSRIDMLCSYIDGSEYMVEGYRKDKDKLFVTSSDNIDKSRFIVDGYEYMFSKRGSEYELRKLSNTYNANVIFTISLSITSERAEELKAQFEDRLKGV